MVIVRCAFAGGKTQVFAGRWSVRLPAADLLEPRRGPRRRRRPSTPRTALLSSTALLRGLCHTFTCSHWTRF